MKRFIGCVCFLITTVVVPSLSLADALSTFTEDLDGWTCSGSGSCTWEVGGFLRFVDGGGAKTEAIAPGEFLGDWSAYSGVGAISFDHKVIEHGYVTDYLPYQIVIRGEGGVEAVWMKAYNPLFVGEWVRINAALVESQWAVTGGTLLQVLENVTEIRIALEVVDNSGGTGETDAIDNVGIGINQSCWCPASVGSTRCGPEELRGSEVFNDLGMLIIPIGALILLRISHRKK